MSINIPWDEIPDNVVVVVDPGLYTVTLESLDEERSPKGNLMYTGILRIEEPEASKGLPLFERFVVGTPADPDAKDPITWTSQTNVAAKLLKALIKATGTALMGSMDEVRASAVKCKLIVQVAKKVEPPVTKAGITNPYAGRESNTITRYYPLVGATTGLAVPVMKPGAAAAKPATKTAAVGLVACGFCGERVPRASYTTHAATHEE